MSLPTSNKDQPLVVMKIATIIPHMYHVSEVSLLNKWLSLK